MQSAQLAKSWCVIADVKMPGTSGVELQSQLQTLANRLPFVFVTTLAEDMVRVRALQDGATCFLTKSVDQ